MRIGEIEIDGIKPIRKIGEGGFGEVFLASDGGGYVALKIICADRLKREEEALVRYARIPPCEYIAPILKSGRAADFLYYTMPLADSVAEGFDDPESPLWLGKSLSSLIAQRLENPNAAWFSRGEILEIITPVFEAAAHLSRNGMLHRDIKPDNVLFFGGRAKLADIGLMRADSPSASNLGTPLYAPPKWYLARGGNPDMYGLAATFYTLITGNPPDSIGRAAYNFPECEKGRVSARMRAQYEHWHRLILRALAENPAERFLRIEDFLSAVKSEDFEASKLYAAPPPARKKTALKFAFASAVAALAAAAFFALKTPQKESEVKSNAILGKGLAAAQAGGGPFDWGEFLIFGKTGEKFDADRRDLEIILSRKTEANEVFKKTYPQIRKSGLKSGYGNVRSFEDFLNEKKGELEFCRRQLEDDIKRGDKFGAESSRRNMLRIEGDIENPYKYILSAHADFSRMLENKKGNFNLDEIMKK